ncbi:MAG TPA: hypothetical protein PK513_04185 [Alphaproteobacteria bacterium]|nr:MAG: hypothetical protein H6859_10910 [Rhodospirillales bacterium]HOO81681.1 hypothetical protein [Alphaproteobacteria bacterium]
MKNIYNFRQIKYKFYQFLLDERGSTALEYGLMLAGFSLAIAGATSLIGNELSTTIHDGLSPLLSTQIESSEGGTSGHLLR